MSNIYSEGQKRILIQQLSLLMRRCKEEAEREGAVTSCLNKALKVLQNEPSSLKKYNARNCLLLSPLLRPLQPQNRRERRKKHRKSPQFRPSSNLDRIMDVSPLIDDRCCAKNKRSTQELSLIHI